jgi:hypothetical protein
VNRAAKIMGSNEHAETPSWVPRFPHLVHSGYYLFNLLLVRVAPPSGRALESAMKPSNEREPQTKSENSLNSANSGSPAKPERKQPKNEQRGKRPPPCRAEEPVGWPNRANGRWLLVHQPMAQRQGFLRRIEGILQPPGAACR